MGAFWEIFGIVLLSSVKFLPAPFFAIGAGFGFLKSIVITFSGGACGLFFFYYLGGYIFLSLKKKPLFSKKQNAPRKKVFTRTNKLIVKIKAKYGLIGLAFITPAIISIPIGSILASRYFGKDKRTLSFLILSLLFWCISLTSLAYFFRESVSYFS